MDNSTVSFYFNFTAFVDIGHYRYPVFVFCLLLYSFIVSANLVIILVISRERTLHEPMFTFIALLSVNSLYGSTGFFPRFLMDLLSDTHLISRNACFTQIYIIYTYGSNEMTVLGIIAYDRYVAVCDPLHYHTRMASKTVVKLAALALLLPAFGISSCIFLAARLPLCGTEIQKVFCAFSNIFKLSCISTVVNSIYGFGVATLTVFFPLFFILYTYVRIVAVCLKSSAEFKGKVFQSCMPHVVSFVIYSITGFCDIVLNRSNIEQVNPFVAVYVVVPQVLNPLVYGLQLPQIRTHIFKILSWYKINS